MMVTRRARHVAAGPRRALVTGGSGEIGAAICRELAAAGYEVLVHANRRADSAAAIVETIRSQGGAASSIVFDAVDASATDAALERALADAPIQVVINNAGIHRDAVMAGMTREAWHDVIAVSLDGFFNVTRPLLLPMLRTRWGRIVNIASMSGVLGNRGQTNYSAAKAGLIGATRSLALEVASRGVTVNAVAPGIIASAMADEAFPQDRIDQLVPMGRAGTPEEVAALVGFLCSDRAGYISGQVIAINGAMA